MKMPLKPPDYRQSVKKLPARFLTDDTISAAPGGRYYHWHTLSRIAPPKGLTSKTWWAALKLARRQTRRVVPLVDTDGRQFSYTMPDPALEMLHTIDQGASGQVKMPDAIANPQSKERYLQSSLIEEAITSSQLEGAATTRAAAKEMLRAGRRPADINERMILNNYRAMQLLGERTERRMTPTLVKEIHRTIAQDTLSKEYAPPWLRTQGDDIGVWDEDRLLHKPPAAAEIPARMEALCKFANNGSAGGFMHPVVRAILLHFWLAYDHPFVDGNGRTARALFYWAMLRQGYWLAEFISISSILRKAPSKYVASFLYTESDDGDLTYFILAQLRVICRAIRELHNYIARKAGEVQKIEQMLRATAALNHRQTALLAHALRNPGFRYTIQAHCESHGITYATGRSDLLKLEEMQLLVHTRSGRQFSFAAREGLVGRLRGLG